MTKTELFAVELHSAITKALNLPAYAGYFGFRYAELGEFPHLDLVSFGR